MPFVCFRVSTAPPTTSDLRDAFYRVVRPFLSMEVPSDEAVAATFRALKLPPRPFHAFQENVGRESAITRAGGSPWLQGTIDAVLAGRWFKLPGQNTVVATSRGTRPGDNLADILFSFVFADVLAAIREVLEVEARQHGVPWKPEMRGNVGLVDPSGPEKFLSLHEATWMDDLCVVAATHTTSALFDALKQVSGALLDECLGKGMMPNLKSNKTEVLLHCSGKGAKAARRDLLSDKEPTVATASRYWPEARIKVVPRYRHLGGILHHRAGLGAEARSRAAQAWHAFQKHKKTIFVHANVYLEDKTVLFGTLVLSTLFHACGTWGQIDADAFSVLNRAYVNMARAILSKHFRGDLLHLCEDRVLALLRLPSLSTWIHFHRLSYLASFVVISEPLVWALAHAERHWLAAVRDSLAWLWRHVDGGRKFPSWEDAWPHWCDDIKCRPRAWKSLIRFGRDSALRAEVLAEGWQQCRGTVVKRAIRAGGFVPAWVDGFGEGSCACGPCQKVFGSLQAWSVHAFKVHGRVKPSRCYVAGEQCPVCLRQYASNVQLCLHI